MIKGNLRLIFSVLDSKEIEIIYHEFFEMSFKSNFSYLEIIENLTNESDFLLEILNEKNILGSGIFEIYGIYSHDLHEKYNYYNDDAYDFEWEFEAVGIKKYSESETKDFIEKIYIEENPNFALHLVDKLCLKKDIRNIRLSEDVTVKYNGLFKF
jgi:hypothetical protein